MYTTPKALSERFKVTERSITKLARDGILPGIRIGNLWRFSIRDIEEWESAQRVNQDEVSLLVKGIVEETKKGRR